MSAQAAGYATVELKAELHSRLVTPLGLEAHGPEDHFFQASRDATLDFSRGRQLEATLSQITQVGRRRTGYQAVER